MPKRAKELSARRVDTLREDGRYWELRRTRSVRAPSVAISTPHLAEASSQAIPVVAATPIPRESHSFEFCARTYVAAQAPEGGELSNSAFGAVIDGMHEADIKRGGTGYLDPVQNRIATQHGCRSTFRDWAAEVATFPSEVIEHALAHKLKDEAQAAYQRGTLLMKRAALMEQPAIPSDMPPVFMVWAHDDQLVGR